ncbi:aspartate aminotransferase [Mesotoga sp. BH458_6_3_2_1]|uniref:aspartate aminotransferase n=1 Tax=Mesotoga sp. BH458_6_3_2_1 TaxID=1437446 RepID=UPI000EF1F9CC|nr:aspartate aminotransferase [Mesotoga sp. BH458_6_3_2_1]RLL87502.1 aspartate aminotransferase [Mesotoga sp. BH458_6_3_2_1]
MDLSHFVSSVTPSATLEFNKKALDLAKSGENVVKFTAGEPDFPTPRPIVDAAIKALNEGKTKYTNASGIDELRKAITVKLQKDNGLNYSPEEIVVSNGGKQAIYNVLKALLNVGDEVLIISPAWVSYEAQILLCGGVPVVVPARVEKGFVPEISEIEKAITDRTRAIMINSPNNPTGAIYPEEFLRVLGKLCVERDLFVISDEVYEKLVFDAPHFSIASIEGMKERTAVINAFSKTYAMTGWRVGYSAISMKLARAISKIQSHLSSNVNTMAQYAAVKAFEVDTSSMVEEFRKRRDYVISRLEKIGLKFSKPAGAFYVFIDIRSFLGGRFRNSNDFAIGLLEEQKVGMVPGSAFSYEGFIRMSFSSSTEELKEGLDRFDRFLKTL